MRMMLLLGVVVACAMTLQAQVRPTPQPRSPVPERGYGTAAERTRQAGEARVVEERRDGADGGGSGTGAAERESPFRPVPEARAEALLLAVDKRLKSVRSQTADFVAAEYGPAGLAWQARGRYESRRTADGSLSERLHLTPEIAGKKPAEERLLFVTSEVGRCVGWRHTDKGAVPLGDDPLSIAVRGPVLLFDLLPPDPVHMKLLHAGEGSLAGVKVAKFAAEPRHGRKGTSYELVFDRSNAGVMRGMVGTESSPIVAFSDTNISVDGFRVSSSRKFQWGKEGTYLILQFSNRRVNTPADAARFTTEGLAH